MLSLVSLRAVRVSGFGSSLTAPSFTPDASFDGGDLDCGNGLLLLIRRHIDPLPRGALLEILSTETSVQEDLPAWCRLTGNEFVSMAQREGRERAYLVCKGALAERASTTVRAPRVAPITTTSLVAARGSAQ